MKIVVLDGYTLNPGDLNWKRLKELGDCDIYDRTDPEQIYERAKNAKIILANKVVLDKYIINKLPKLKYIGVLATGYNIVDLNAAKEAGIIITNIPAYSTESVSQMVFAHILNYTQRVELHSNSVKKGDWSKSIDFTYQLTPQIELEGKILGIIGFGKIGQSVAKKGLAFGMKVIFQNRSIKEETLTNTEQVDLDTIFERSDFISINCPLSESNVGFVNNSLLNKAKSSAFIINTGRGGLLNENDVAEVLNTGRIAGLGADVLSTEPPEENNPLLTAKNCYITPHIAWATKEARERLMNIAVNNIERFINGKPENLVGLDN